VSLLDAVYVSAYSVLILNTNLHNGNLKESDIMSKETFIKMVCCCVHGSYFSLSLKSALITVLSRWFMSSCVAVQLE